MTRERERQRAESEDADDTTVDALRQDLEQGTEERPVRIPSEELSFGLGEEPPIPLPWQGIPRLAATISLQYRYSETQDAWVRDTGSDTGGEAVQRTIAKPANLITVPTNNRKTIPLENKLLTQVGEIGGNNESLIIQKDGVYRVSQTTQIANIGSGNTVTVEIRRDNTPLLPAFPVGIPTTGEDMSHVEGSFRFNSGEAISLTVTNLTGSSVDVFSGTSGTQLSVELLE